MTRSTTRYAHHPDVRTVGEALFPADGSHAAVVLNEMGAFVWERLEAPKTLDELVFAVTHEFEIDTLTAQTEVRSFLEQLLAESFAVIVDDSSPPMRPAEPPGRTTGLLAGAYKRQKAGDWQGALALCDEASRLAEQPDIVELDTLICRYHLGAATEVVGRALALIPRLPIMARIACSGLALASAYEAGDLGTAKGVACRLAREISEPWDLPTVPTFVLGSGEKVVVTESRSVDLFLEIIESLRTRVPLTAEESRLLDALGRRYRERGAA